MEQDERFPGKIDNFHFVSNHCFMHTTSPGRMGKSPIRMKQAVDSCASLKDLPEPFREPLAHMATELSCDAEGLLDLRQACLG